MDVLGELKVVISMGQGTFQKLLFLVMINSSWMLLNFLGFGAVALNKYSSLAFAGQAGGQPHSGTEW